jgi:uncharacterized protein (DUF1919 family)
MVKKVLDKLQHVLSLLINHVYEQYMRARLKNKDFTILCSNCIGGIIYHRLGLQFRSPTVNLWMRQRDFIEFAKNIRKYERLELQFIQSDYDYPVAKLGDITIYFNHHNNEEDARNDWNRRMKRINHDNLFLIMYDREDISEADILGLDQIKCNGKLVLSDRKHPHIPYVKTMKPGKHLYGKQFIDRDWFGLRTFEKHFDYVKWLNQE